MIGLLFEGHDYPVGDAGDAVIEPDPGFALKLEYQMLTKTERCFRELAVFWSNKTEIMKQVMDLMLYEDNGLQYEAILQLSLFILLPNRSEAILNLLVKNAQAIVDIIRPFEPHSHDENFRVL